MSGADLPAPLIAAHAAGELVIFVGAGASIPPPSAIPSFKSLVETIRDESNLGTEIGDLQERRLDEVLGDIAGKYGVDVHRRLNELTGRKGARPNPVHKAIAKLASAYTVRIVTTNYDSHLSTGLQALGVVAPEFLAPALPMGDDFTGIVYIHGRVDQEPRRLIATDQDFGKAYLTDAWAARFLDRMFATRPVLFVGYSHKDTIMKYLARGLGGRSERRYVLTDEPGSELWRQLGIVAIECSHQSLPTVIDDWATRAAGGLLGHRARVKSLVAEQDPSPVPESVTYLESILGDKSTVEFFTEHARGLLWLQWAAGRPEFAALFEPLATIDAEITRALAGWLADHYIDDDELSDIALQLVAAASTPPGPELTFAIAKCVARAEYPLSERIRRWLLVLTGSPATSFTTTILTGMLHRISLDADTDTALFLFDYLSEPTIRVTHSFFGTDFEAITRDNDLLLPDIWERTFKPVLTEYAGRILTVVDRHLRRADLQLALAGESDRGRPSAWRTSIKPDGDDESRGPMGFLIDAARDCLASLLTARAPEGPAYLDAWAASQHTLLRRLAIHGWTLRADKNGSEKILWLRAMGWLRVYELRPEVAELLTNAAELADAATVRGLVGDVLEHCEDDEYAPRWAYGLLTSISAAAPSHENVADAMTSLTVRYPELVPPERVEAEAQSAWAAAPNTADELHDALASDSEGAAAALSACEAARSPFDDQDRWLRLVAAISTAVRVWPEDGFALADALGGGHTEIDRAIIRGWSTAAVDATLGARILLRIKDFDLEPILGYVTTMLGGYAYAGFSAAEWFMFPHGDDVAKQCWGAINSAAQGREVSDEPVMWANNHPAGHLAQYWIDKVSALWRSSGEAWDGIPPEIADYLVEMLSTDDGDGHAATFVFASRLHFFYEADPEWCRQFLLPLFDWSDTNRAQGHWRAYLAHGGWTDKLLSEGLLDRLVETAAHASDLGDRATHMLTSQLAVIALSSDADPNQWLPLLLTSGTVDEHVAWTVALGHQLHSLEPELVEQHWGNWISSYLSRRLSSVPRPLHPREASTMARWVLSLSESMPAGIDLLLRTHTAGFDSRSLFFYELDDTHIDRAPTHIARLLHHMLMDTQPPFCNSEELEAAYVRLEQRGVADAILRDLAEAAMHLRIELVE